MTYLVIAILVACQLLCNVKFGIHAETLSGSQSGHKVLTKSGSPHTVISDYTVKAEATLELKPGTELRFNSGVSLRIHGQLNAMVRVYFILKSFSL